MTSWVPAEWLVMQHDDFVRAGNHAPDPSLYDVENAAIDRDGSLWSALCRRAPWSEQVLLDLTSPPASGCRGIKTRHMFSE